jgi:hypothetical protein
MAHQYATQMAGLAARKVVPAQLPAVPAGMA